MTIMYEKGYMISVTSYEGDLDSYNTKTIGWLTRESALAYARFCDALSAIGTDPEVEDYKTLYQIALAANMVGEIDLDGITDEDEILDIWSDSVSDLIYEVLGYAEHKGLRSVSDIRVVYFEADVYKVNLEDLARI